VFVCLRKISQLRDFFKEFIRYFDLPILFCEQNFSAVPDVAKGKETPEELLWMEANCTLHIAVQQNSV
jgi:hypothetical protein